MPDKWTTASARREFLRRERDILDRHRMERDIQTDYQELLAQQSRPAVGGNMGGLNAAAGNPDENTIV